MSTDSSPLVPATRLVRRAPVDALTPLAAGFRPFFFLCGLYAVAMVLTWTLTYGLSVPTAGPFAGARLHAHEMIFGFAFAAVAGFLLTAVPSWTGSAAIRGGPLLACVLAWLAGRLAVLGAAHLPASLVAGLDLLAPLVVIALIAPRLVRAKNRRNYAFVAVLLAFALANGLTHLEPVTPGLPSGVGARAGVALATLLIVLVGGRIVPAFTRSALAAAGSSVAVRARPRLGKAALALTALALLIDLLRLPGWLVAAASALAALALAARLSGWGGWAARRDPLVLILHVGYAFVPLGLAARAATYLGVAMPGTTALHLLTTGAVGTMILAVMTRATLGHTGRPLRASAATTAA